MCYVPLFF
jgi:hypothetical protein